MHVCLSVFAGGHVCVAMHVEAEGQHQVSLLGMQSTFFKTRFLTGQETTNQLHWLTHP